MIRRLSLRTRLVLGLLVLAAVGLVIADVATYKSQESFLFDQTDQTLQSEHQFAERGPGGSHGPGLPPGTYVEVRDQTTGSVLYQNQGSVPRGRGGAAAPPAVDDPSSTRPPRASATPSATSPRRR